MNEMDRRKFLELAALTSAAAFVVALPACASTAGTTQTTGGLRNGFDQAGLDRLHKLLAGYVDRGILPGAVVLLGRGAEVWVDPVGAHMVGGGTAMRRDTIFRIASMTKPITAAATMMLVEAGKIRLDEPVDRLLPELANRRVLKSIDVGLEDTVPAVRPIVVRDLLAFTMGFGIVFPLDTYPIQNATSQLHVSEIPPRPHAFPEPDEWMRRLGTLPLMYQPGERWLYNTPADVLGVLVRRASGQPFDAFLRDRIFEPLGMSDTGFNVPPAKIFRVPEVYFANPETKALVPYAPLAATELIRMPAFPSGAGGLYSTVDDFHVFARMLLNGGEHNDRRILSADSVRQMTTDQLTPQQKAGSGLFPGFFNNRGWGFGVSMITRADDVSAVPGRYGWDGGFGTYWYNDPAKRLVGMLMTQRAIDQQSPAPAFWKAVYESMRG
jgi:CubicO group peptidase (beta-lactamase class C family)